MEYKHQHTVPISYMKEWCDPQTPTKYTPYVWIISKDGKSVRNKPPDKIFFGMDFYTVYDENGKRDVSMEKYLHKVEDDYIRVRTKIKSNQPISINDYRVLVRFIVASYSRTNLQKQDQKSIWRSLLHLYRVFGLSKYLPNAINRVNQLYLQPMIYHIINFMRLTIPVLFTMNIELIETSDNIGYITSDNPVQWIDLSIITDTPNPTFMGLGSPLLEILLPITPKMLIRLYKGMNNEIKSNIDDIAVFTLDINRMIVNNCDKSIIMNRNSPNKLWF